VCAWINGSKMGGGGSTMHLATSVTEGNVFSNLDELVLMLQEVMKGKRGELRIVQGASLLLRKEHVSAGADGVIGACG
jgi:hypothetical protein